MVHTITLKSDDKFYNTLEEMVKSLNTTKSNLIRKAVVYYKDALEKERLKEQIKMLVDDQIELKRQLDKLLEEIPPELISANMMDKLRLTSNEMEKAEKTLEKLK